MKKVRNCKTLFFPASLKTYSPENNGRVLTASEKGEYCLSFKTIYLTCWYLYLVTFHQGSSEVYSEPSETPT